MEEKKVKSFTELWVEFNRTSPPKSDMFGKYIQKLIEEGYIITDMVDIGNSAQEKRNDTEK